MIVDEVLIPGYPNSDGMDVYIEKSVKLSLPGRTPVVMIINGNGYGKSAYAEMATFLARNGFVVAVAEREFVSSDPLFPLNALNSVFALHDIDEDSPIGFVGHSFGGFVVNEAAIEQVNLGLDFNLKSIINVAPNIRRVNPLPETLSGQLNGLHTASFLSIWGSRDRDMEGLGGIPREGIAAYDRVGTESSTTCGNPPCFVDAEDLIEKVSVYVNGADHAEFMGTVTVNAPGDYAVYLDTPDQTCIGKAYLNAFLRKHLTGYDKFDRFLRKEVSPPSFKKIFTSADDGLGQPAGAALRIYHQYSPVQKRSLENFEDDHYDVYADSGEILHFIIQEGSNVNAPFYIRHQSSTLLVAWAEQNTGQYIGFEVPPYAEDASTFTHLSMRIGQLNGMPYPMYANGHEDLTIRMGLFDQSFQAQDEYVTIPRADTHSTMQTVTIPLEDLNGVNMDQLRMVYLAFDSGTQGTLIIDNIEFIRD
ncbi:alpha/beta hydrolase [Marinicella meishanensis]|uniref:alpha/beta hydrolase n=1 Tax=Marinicella meishanensis TaxID=2873263 RepID=UPI001CBB3977|nr:alpha/beta hydrolase [Marinicella sp. NBU2979]